MLRAPSTRTIMSSSALPLDSDKHLKLAVLTPLPPSVSSVNIVESGRGSDTDERDNAEVNSTSLRPADGGRAAWSFVRPGHPNFSLPVVLICRLARRRIPCRSRRLGRSQFFRCLFGRIFTGRIIRFATPCVINCSFDRDAFVWNHVLFR